MELKTQDFLARLKLVAHPGPRWTYAAPGEALAMSTSETHACVQRAVACGLTVAPARGEWSPLHPAPLEFMRHGLRHIWPSRAAPVNRRTGSQSCE